MSEKIHVISLGAGVQSSAMALMAAEGLITPMPSFAVFADTGDEPRAVYEWLSQLAKLLPFTVHMAYRRNGLPARPGAAVNTLSEFVVENGFSQIPCFTRSLVSGKSTIGKRQCTRHWKIDPIKQKIREVLGTKGRRMESGSVVLWQGISWDEVSRMKPSRDPWIEHHFPLIDRKLTRDDLKAWLNARGFNPPKSACVYCPYKDRARWRADKAAGGEEWETIRKVDAILAPRGEYLTADLKRIDEVDFSDPVDTEDPDQLYLFNNECEGMCGV